MKLSPTFRYSLFGFLVILSFAFLSHVSFAQATSTFSGTGNWSTGSWNSGVPITTTAVTIANGANCTLDVDPTVASIVVQGGGANTTLTIGTGRALIVTGAVSIEAPNTNSNITNSIVVGAGTLTIQSSGLTLTGGAATQIADITIGSGSVNITGGITSSNPQGQVTFTTSGTLALTGDFPAVAALTFVPSNGKVTFNRSGDQNIGAGHTFGELAVDGSGTKTVTGTGNISVNGGIIRKGTAIFALAGKTLTYGIDSRVEYSGSSLQTTGDEFTSTVAEVWVNNAAGVNLTGGARTVNGGASSSIGFDIQNGTFSDGGNLITCTSALNVSATGGFKVSATSVPAFSGISLIAGSTVEYAGGGSQDVVAAAYSNLIFSGAGTKHVKSGLTIGGDWAVGSPVNLSTFNPTFTVTGSVSGSGVITMGSGIVTVIGNWSASGGTTGGSGAVKLTGASPTISATTFANLTLDNNTGATLSGAVTVNGALTLTTGKVTTDATNILRLGSSSSVSVNPSLAAFVIGPVVNIWSTGTLSKVFPLGKASTYRPLEISLTTPLSPEIRAEVFNASAGGTSALNAISVNRYYQTSLLSGTAASGGTAKITFGADDGVSTVSNLVVAQSTTQGGVYSTLGQSANTSTTVTSTSYNPASGNFLLLGSTGGNALPVQLKSFSAAANRLSSELHWSTSTETDNYGFEVERRAVSTQQSAVSSQLSAISWQKVGFVAGSGTSSTPRDYSYADRNLASGRYAYRLKQVDNDGTSSYSGSAEVEIGLAAKEFKLESNYPNPFNPSTTIAFTLADDGKATLKVFNMLGQEVATLFDGEAQAGRIQQVKFDASRLPSGLYFAKLEAGKQQMLRKMMLVK